MSGLGEEVLVGAICLVLALLLVGRIGRGLRTGEIGIYRTRIKRTEAGEARFFALVGINVLMFLAMSVIAADLLLGLGLRAR